MLDRIKSLKEVSEEIGEEIGKKKEFDTKNGYYVHNTRTHREFELIDSKLVTELSFKDKKEPISYGYFKSKKGYNSRYKNSKEYANHYGEYIAYIILKQLGKKACKVDIGTRDIHHPFSNKTITIEGILSHHQLSREEIFRPFSVSLNRYRGAQYREATPRGKTNADANNTNIELIVSSLEYELESNGQESYIPEMRKEVFDMCIFDLKFANRDRHDDNFGSRIDQVNGKIQFYHLFDNEQILGFQEEKKDIQRYLNSEKDYEKFKNKELTSCIGIPGASNKVTYQKLLKYLLEHYYDETMNSLKDFGRYKLSNLEEVLDIFPNLSEEHKKLAEKIFTEREIEINQTVKEFENERLKSNDGDVR